MILPIAVSAAALAVASNVTSPQVAPLLPANRVVVYYQTQYDSSLAPNSPFGHYVSPLPLQNTASHLIVASIHLQSSGDPIHLNDNPPNATLFDQMWADVATLQASGMKAMALLGGAAPGSYPLLSGSNFASHYPILTNFLRTYKLDGIDLDVEESTALSDIQRLVTSLRNDFGPNFIITMAPVASALEEGGNLSGFDYIQFEKSSAGSEINFYNAQFYSGFGSFQTDAMYIQIVNFGMKLDPARLVAGTLTSPNNGGGFVPINSVVSSIKNLIGMYGTEFGGVAGWEYFNSLPGGNTAPQQWASTMKSAMQGAGARKRYGPEVRKRVPLRRWVPEE